MRSGDNVSVNTLSPSDLSDHTLLSFDRKSVSLTRDLFLVFASPLKMLNIIFQHNTLHCVLNNTEDPGLKINKYFDGSLTRARLGRQDGGLMNPPAWGNYHFKTIKLSVSQNTEYSYVMYRVEINTNLSDPRY